MRCNIYFPFGIIKILLNLISVFALGGFIDKMPCIYKFCIKYQVSISQPGVIIWLKSLNLFGLKVNLKTNNELVVEIKLLNLHFQGQICCFILFILSSCESQSCLWECESFILFPKLLLTYVTFSVFFIANFLTFSPSFAP